MLAEKWEGSPTDAMRQTYMHVHVEEFYGEPSSGMRLWCITVVYCPPSYPPFSFLFPSLPFPSLPFPSLPSFPFLPSLPSSPAYSVLHPGSDGRNGQDLQEQVWGEGGHGLWHQAQVLPHTPLAGGLGYTLRIIRTYSTKIYTVVMGVS